MNKEYDDLLNYIASCERGQRQEELKLAEEVAKHSHTKASLQQALASIERHKQAIESMQVAMRTMRRQHEEEKKAGKQLRDAIRHLKEEQRLLEQSHLRVVSDCERKRDYYSRMLNTAQERCMLLRCAYETANTATSTTLKGQKLAASDHQADMEEDAGDEENEAALQRKADSLEQSLREALEKKTVLLKQIEDHRSKKAAEAAALASQEQLKKAEAERKAGEVEAELLGLRDVVARQKDLLEQQKQLQESTIKQMRELDQYGNKLSQTFDELQHYCSELEASATCACPAEGLPAELTPMEQAEMAVADAAAVEDPALGQP